MARAVAAGTSIVKVAGGITAVGAVVAMAFTAWFTILDVVADEARQVQKKFYATELQRDADEIAFAIYQVVHQLDEIDFRADNNRARRTDPLQTKQLTRELDILLERQGQVLEALEGQMKEQ